MSHHLSHEVRHPHPLRHDHDRPRHHDKHRHGRAHSHGHAHGLVDHSVVRSREGLSAVLISLAVLGATAAAQAGIYVLSGSVALLADLIHNAGDALTAAPLAAAFLLRSLRAEKVAGLIVVAVIFISACVALYETIARLINPEPLTHSGRSPPPAS